MTTYGGTSCISVPLISNYGELFPCPPPVIYAHGADAGGNSGVLGGRVDDGEAPGVERVVLRPRRVRGRRRPRSLSSGQRYIVSHDHPVELKPMTVPRPKLTLEEAAMQSVTNRVASQPRLHVRRADAEPQLVYTRGIYRPQPVYWRGTADTQGFSFLHNSSQDSRSRDLNQTNDEDDDEDEDDDSPGPGMKIIIVIVGTSTRLMWLDRAEARGLRLTAKHHVLQLVKCLLKIILHWAFVQRIV